MSKGKLLRAMCCAALCWFGIGSASSALIARGPDMVYDDVLNITWLRNFNYAMTSGYDSDGLMTWSAASTWADSLTVGGYDDWRLPTFDPLNARPTVPTTSNEIGSLWSELNGGSYIDSTTDISPFFNLPYQAGLSEWYWTARQGSYADPSDLTRAWRISMNCACWDSQQKTEEFYAIAVRTGSVPEPSTLALLGLGLAGLAATRRRKQ